MDFCFTTIIIDRVIVRGAKCMLLRLRLLGRPRSSTTTAVVVVAAPRTKPKRVLNHLHILFVHTRAGYYDGLLLNNRFV